MRGDIAMILDPCKIISFLVTTSNSKLRLSATNRLWIFPLYVRKKFILEFHAQGVSTWRLLAM